MVNNLGRERATSGIGWDEEDVVVGEGVEGEGREVDCSEVETVEVSFTASCEVG